MATHGISPLIYTSHPLREVEDRSSSLGLRLSRFLESLELLCVCGGCLLVFPTRPSCPRPAIRGCGCGEHWPGVHSASLAGSSRSRKISPAFLCGRVTLCLEGDPFGLPGPWLANNQAYTSLAGAPPSPGPTPTPPPGVQANYTLRPNLQTIPRGPSSPWGGGGRGPGL